MVRLKNIKKNSTVIECDIFPEDSSLNGRVVVDIKSGILKEYSLPEGFEWCIKHVKHAQNRLIKLIEKEILPDEQLVMWN